MLKYVEMHGRSGTSMPWSVHQMATYQKVNIKTQVTKIIMVQVSADVRRRIQEVAESDESCQDLSEHWASLHTLLLGTLNRNWAAYIKCLDIEVDKLVSIQHSTWKIERLIIYSSIIRFGSQKSIRWPLGICRIFTTWRISY